MFSERGPLLLISGDTSPDDLGNLQDIQQRELVIATGAGYEAARSVETLVADLMAARRRAILERRPVVFTVPKFVFDRLANPDLRDRTLVRLDPAKLQRIQIRGWKDATSARGCATYARRSTHFTCRRRCGSIMAGFTPSSRRASPT